MAVRSHPLALAIATTVLVAGAVQPLHAEEGDYGFLRTLFNLVHPPKADNPVTPAQREGTYPLLSNPIEFDDGFVPADYGKWQTVHSRRKPAPPAATARRTSSSSTARRTRATPSSTWKAAAPAGISTAAAAGRRARRAQSQRHPRRLHEPAQPGREPGHAVHHPGEPVRPRSRPKSGTWSTCPTAPATSTAATRSRVYEDPTGVEAPLVWHHNGLRNNRAVVAWLKDNLQRPTQMLSTGCSAGGAGTLTNYAVLRRDMAPSHAYMLDDSGPIFEAPRGADPEEYPQLPLQEQIRASWGWMRRTARCRRWRRKCRVRPRPARLDLSGAGGEVSAGPARAHALLAGPELFGVLVRALLPGNRERAGRSHQGSADPREMGAGHHPPQRHVERARQLRRLLPAIPRPQRQPLHHDRGFPERRHPGTGTRAWPTSSTACSTATARCSTRPRAATRPIAPSRSTSCTGWSTSCWGERGGGRFPAANRCVPVRARGIGVAACRMRRTPFPAPRRRPIPRARHRRRGCRRWKTRRRRANGSGNSASSAKRALRPRCGQTADRRARASRAGAGNADRRAKNPANSPPATPCCCAPR